MRLSAFWSAQPSTSVWPRSLLGGPTLFYCYCFGPRGSCFLFCSSEPTAGPLCSKCSESARGRGDSFVALPSLLFTETSLVELWITKVKVLLGLLPNLQLQIPFPSPPWPIVWPCYLSFLNPANALEDKCSCPHLHLVLPLGKETWPLSLPGSVPLFWNEF